MKYFGTDGFRGRANEGLNVEHAFKIGRYVGWYYGMRQNRKARIVVGKDTRRSSYMFESALIAALLLPVQMPICCTLSLRQVLRSKRLMVVLIAAL